MMKKVDVAIIEAGTAGLSAMSQVQGVTANFVLINGGTIGTTCA
jgi:dihydrolipoamide dehydrogenase